MHFLAHIVTEILPMRNEVRFEVWVTLSDLGLEEVELNGNERVPTKDLCCSCSSVSDIAFEPINIGGNKLFLVDQFAFVVV